MSVAGLVLVVGYYGPMLIGALADPSTAAKLEGLNYFADTLLFGGTILSLAYATTQSNNEIDESSKMKK